MKYYETKKNIALTNFKTIVNEMEEMHKSMEQALEDGGLVAMLEEAKERLDVLTLHVNDKLDALEFNSQL